MAHIGKFDLKSAVKVASGTATDFVLDYTQAMIEAGIEVSEEFVFHLCGVKVSGAPVTNLVLMAFLPNGVACPICHRTIEMENFSLDLKKDKENELNLPDFEL